MLKLTNSNISNGSNVISVHTTVQELEMILSQKITNLNVSNGYSMYIDYKQKNCCIVIINYFIGPNTYLCHSCIGCTFLTLPLLDINRNYEMFAHHDDNLSIL